MDSDTDNYNITSIEKFHSKNINTFGIQISFERNWKGIRGILINYHMMCVMLVLVGSINFLIEPNVVPGRAGLLVTLFLVLTNFFSNAQVNKELFSLHMILITEIKSFNDLGRSCRLHCFNSLCFDLHDIHCKCYVILWIDFIQLAKDFE